MASLYNKDLLVDLNRAPDAEIFLWPGKVPGETEATRYLSPHYVERNNEFRLRDRAAKEISKPSIKVFNPEKPNGSALLIIPGGGYKHVVVEKEGYEGARLFNKLGMTVYVLKYRLPHQGWLNGSDVPLQDAQRAIRVIRSRAQEDGINPQKIAVMGFSAGGHLAASLSTRYDAEVYEKVDSIDFLSAKPNLSALIYPVITMKEKITHTGSRDRLIGPNPSNEMVEKYSVDISPENIAPPTFIMHSADDEAVSVQNSLMMYQTLLLMGVSVELHLFSTGGHGYGVRGIEKLPQKSWPELFHNFVLLHNMFE